MERQEGTGVPWFNATGVLGLLGSNSPQSKEATQQLAEQQVDKQIVEAIHAVGGAMPSEEPTMTDGAAMERLEAIKADSYKMTASNFAQNYNDLIQINTLLVMEVLRLREKCDKLLIETLRTNWLSRTGNTTGDLSLVGRR